MNRFFFATIITMVSISTYASAKEVSVNGNKAKALYLAFGGNAVATKSGHDRIINVTDVECVSQTETQQGDPDVRSEELTLTLCGATNARGDSEDYLSVNAIRVSNALKRAGIRQVGNSKNGTMNVKSISCIKSVESQQGDPDIKPELLVMYSCNIQQ